ncbi:MAG: exopolysaccharide biosynthesis polyprenyl glycosylphosphotransferase [Aristaeellaceae bacterium]
MKTILGRLRRHKTALTMAFFRMMVYGCLALLFFGLMAVNNWPLRHPSRTLATTLLTYGAMSLAMHAVYGGYAVGKKKSKPVISSMSLATLATDVVTYLQLQIMNVNGNKNQTLILFGEDFPWLVLCMAAQVLLIVFWVRLGNGVYFTINPPKKCLLILRDKGQEARLRRKIGRYPLQWQVTGAAMCDAPDIREQIAAHEVIFMASMPEDVKMRLLRTCYSMHKDVISQAALEDIMLSNARQIVVDDGPFLEMAYGKITLGQRILKRLMDIGFSLAVLVVLLPVFLLIGLAIRLEDGGPVLFRQRRMSVNGRTFSICKFRTMSVIDSMKTHQTSVTRNDQRITKVGRVLRRFRLDELPQFWNILTGDMTLVGPRPEMLENVEKYKEQLPDFAYREKMKAGLTGYAQIEGRYNTTPEDKLMLDLMYIESFSLWLDVKLIFRTLTVFFKSDSTEGFPAEDEEKDGNSGISARG